MANSESLEYLNQARSFVEVEQYDDALEYINKSISADKLNKELYIQKSIILANLEKFNEAIEETKKALSLDKAYGEAYFHLGNFYLMTGERALGLENYNKAIAYGFDDAQIYYNLGLLFEEDGNEELAIRNYTKCIMSDPLNVEARARKAKIYIDNGKLQEALETINELIMADPDLYDGYHLKSLILAEMGKIDEALKIVEDAELLFPKDPAFPIDKINLLVMNGDKDEANKLVAEIENKFELSPEQKRHLELEKSRLYALDANIEMIVESLKKAKSYSKEFDPDGVDAESNFLLTNCYLEMKDYASAIDCSKELIDCDNLAYAIPAYYTLPLAYKQSGDNEKAEEQFKESIQKLRAITLENPALLDGYLFRAMCLKEIAQYEKALELCDYLLKIDDKIDSYHRIKAEVLYAMGDEKGAVEEKNIAESLA